MAFIDYYKILGVDKDIAQDKVRDAYRRRAKQFHPDLHPNDPKAKAKFQALNEAYTVINDPEKRKKYDQYGEHWKEAEQYGNSGQDGQRFHWTSQEGSPFEGFDFDNLGGGRFSSFFEQLFGKGRGRQQRRYENFQNNFGNGFATGRRDSGQMNATVNIDLYTALLGGEILIQLNSGTKVKLKVKPVTQNGTKVRLRGKGYNRGDGTCGDLIITYNVKLPATLSERQKQLVRQMKENN